MLAAIRANNSELKIVAGRAPWQAGSSSTCSHAGRLRGRPHQLLAAWFFETDDQGCRIEARIDPQPGEVSVANNAFGAGMAIDHTKIRVLYLEKARSKATSHSAPSRTGGGDAAVPFQGLQQAADGRPGRRVHGVWARTVRRRLLVPGENR